MINKNKGRNEGRVKAADSKAEQMVTKRGRASNRRGIRYGSRLAGGATEHQESHNHKPHTHGSRKVEEHGTKPRRKTNEVRITSG